MKGGGAQRDTRKSKGLSFTQERGKSSVGHREEPGKHTEGRGSGGT